MSRYVAYYRVSRPSKSRGSLSLEAQQAMVRSYVGDAELIDEYTEIETGTRKGTRPVLAEALRVARKQKATLIVAKLDRLARDTAFVLNLLDSGAEFVAVDFPQANRLMITILSAWAEYEASLISQRTRDALAALLRRGYTKSGKPISKLGNVANLDPAASRERAAESRREAMRAYGHIAEDVRRLREAGTSFPEIARILNMRGERTRSGDQFHKETVRRIWSRLKASQETTVTDEEIPLAEEAGQRPIENAPRQPSLWD